MRVTVRLFARLRDIVGAAELQRDAPEGATAGAIWDALSAEHDELATYRDTVSPRSTRSTPGWTRR